MRDVILAAALCASSCAMPADWRASYLPAQWSQQELAALQDGVALAGGVLVPGEDGDVRVEWRRVIDPERDVYGDYTPTTRVVRICGSCVDGRPEVLRQVTTHEMLHALGGEHVCSREGELPDQRHKDRCSPVGYGPAILNPYINDLDHLTALDLAEIRRHRGADWSP